MRGKSSKRGKVSTKPDRKNKAKRPPQKSKFKSQRESTEVASDLHASLEAMILASASP